MSQSSVADPVYAACSASKSANAFFPSLAANDMLSKNTVERLGAINFPSPRLRIGAPSLHGKRIIGGIHFCTHARQTELLAIGRFDVRQKTAAQAAIRTATCGNRRRWETIMKIEPTHVRSATMTKQ